jgi:hypothetical protein
MAIFAYPPIRFNRFAQRLKNAQPYTAPVPVQVTQMYHPEVAKMTRQVAPGNASTIAIKHRIDEQSVDFGGCSDRTYANKDARVAAPQGKTSCLNFFCVSRVSIKQRKMENVQPWSQIPRFRVMSCLLAEWRGKACGGQIPNKPWQVA